MQCFNYEPNSFNMLLILHLLQMANIQDAQIIGVRTVFFFFLTEGKTYECDRAKSHN